MDEFIIKKIFCRILCVYLFLVISFYFLAGDQLHYRTSRGNMEIPPAESSTTELSAGTVVEQRFISRIQRIESVSVQWGTYYRPNTGTVTIELLHADSGEVLLQKQFDAAFINEGQILTAASEFPIDGLYGYPLTVRLTSDSLPGSAVTPLISNQSGPDGAVLSVNGEINPGLLCFKAEGTDHIWTGQNYWIFSAGLGAILAIMLFAIFQRWRQGKRSYIINALYAMKKYRFLIQQLVERDFKKKYKRSVLGVFWSFLNPLLMMLIQYFIFSTIFRSDIPNFAAYLIIGTVMFNFFSEASSMTLMSILGNAGLITKVYMPKYIYPLTRTMSSVVNLVISLIPMIIVCLVTGVHLHKSAVLSLFFFICLIIFSLGVGMVLSTSMVFFRDTQFLWNVLSTMWMYATPIFYPERIIPDNLRLILKVNPLYHFLKAARMCIMDGLSPEPVVYFRCLMISLCMLAFGAFVFYRNQNKFVLYL